MLAQGANRVLRNAYMLLALGGADRCRCTLLGVQMQFSFMAGSPFLAFLLFLGISFAFFCGIREEQEQRPQR